MILPERILYYWARLFSKGIKKGEESRRKLVRELFIQIKDLETYSKIDVPELIKKGGEWPYDK